ncbi:MAG: hypothetical protein H7338_03650 [Candidatus Sericytochromatia bacterium]|nr:hypothetical protein [Candidatus Sericytochromatia bacterium]
MSDDPYRNLLKPPAILAAPHFHPGPALGEVVCACPACDQTVAFQPTGFRAFCRACGQEVHRLGMDPAAAPGVPIPERAMQHRSP